MEKILNQQNVFKIIFIGRFIELKGILLLPEIATELEKLGVTNFIFQVIGTGDLQQNLQDKIKRQLQI